MRYYDVSIQRDQSAAAPATLQTALGQVTTRWQSHPGGAFNPAALDLEFDLYVGPFAAPLGTSLARLWGVDLATLKAAVALAGNPRANPPVAPMWATVRGGMLAGLPLNQPAQAGVLSAGIVWQSYANWRGTEMTLDLLLNAGGASLGRPANIVLDWQKGQGLQAALQNCLAAAFPGTTIRFAISQGLVAPSTQVHVASTLTGLSQFLQSVTRQMQGPGSLGVQVAAQGGGLTVFDGTAPPATRQVAFTDLIGQPTWQGAYELWVQTVLRGDVMIGDLLQLPPELSRLGPFVLTQPQSYPAYRDQSVIQGSFIVTQQRHVGRFRTPDGVQWSTTFVCVPTTGPQ